MSALSAQDLASGYMSGKLLQKLESVHFMLANHTSDHFGFLKEHSRNRTTFHYTLARLLFMEDTTANFKSFVAPLQQVSTAPAMCEASCQAVPLITAFLPCFTAAFA